MVNTPKAGEVRRYTMMTDGTVRSSPKNNIEMWQYGIGKDGPVLNSVVHGCFLISTYNVRKKLGGLMHLPPDLPPEEDIIKRRKGGNALIPELLEFNARKLEEFFLRGVVTKKENVFVVAGGRLRDIPDDDLHENERYVEKEKEMDQRYLYLLSELLKCIMKTGIRPIVYQSNADKFFVMKTSDGLCAVVNRPNSDNPPMFKHDMQDTNPRCSIDYILSAVDTNP